MGRQVNTILGFLMAVRFQLHLMIHLIKGMFLKRPSTRALVLSSVLETLASSPFEPLQSCTLKNLTLKTVFLISLASGRRRGAIQALSTATGHINFLPHGVRLIPQRSFLAKNQTIDFLPHPIFIPKILSFFLRQRG